MDAEKLMESSEAIETELRGSETRLADWQFRRSARDVAELLDDRFCEFGSSGRTFNKADLIRMLQEESRFQAELTAFRPVQLGTDLVLVTYRARILKHGSEKAACSLRSSIWLRANGKWRVLFHQGTPCSWE